MGESGGDTDKSCCWIGGGYYVCSELVGSGSLELSQPPSCGCRLDEIATGGRSGKTEQWIAFSASASTQTLGSCEIRQPHGELKTAPGGFSGACGRHENER